MMDKLQPQNIEAERAVLGGVLVESEAFHRVADLLGPEDFYRTTHQLIFEEMQALVDKIEPIDLIALTHQLNGNLEKVGGASYLAELLDSTPTAANIEYHAKLVKDTSIRRRIISEARKIIEEAYNSEIETEEALSRAQEKMVGLSLRGTKAFSTMREVMSKALDNVQYAHEKQTGVTGLPTGMAKIDSWTGGMQPGEAWVIGGRTSQGKSALAIGITLHLSSLRFKIAYFSPEMTKEQLGLRFLAAEGRIDLLKLRTGGLHQEEMEVLVPTAGKLAERGILIDDSSVISALDVKARARKLTVTMGLDLIIVDHLQELVEKERFRTRHEAISTEFGRLRALARELDVPIIVVSQLKRTAKDDKKPTLEDLKESGDIENKADVILFVHREEVYNPKPENRGIAEIRIAKQRMGPRKWAEFHFDEKTTHFSELGQKSSPSPTKWRRDIDGPEKEHYEN